MSKKKTYKTYEKAAYLKVLLLFRSIIKWLQVSFRVSVSRGKQKLTILFIPHSGGKVKNFQLSRFSVLGLSVGFAVLITTLVFTAIRFSNSTNTLLVQSSDLALAQSKLEAIQRQTAQLLTAARRFESAITESLGPLSNRVSEFASTKDRVGVPTLVSFQKESEALPQLGVAPEQENRNIGQLQSVTNFLDKTADPMRELGALLKNQSSILNQIPNVWPVQGGGGHISMAFGKNENPFTGQWYIHKGVDISTYRTGDPVIATADGKVAGLGYDPGLGNYIIIQHEHGFITRYAHLLSFRISRGQKVSQGQVIGSIGNTGLTTGPHLHYEVHLGTGVIDPMKFLNIRAIPIKVEQTEF